MTEDTGMTETFKPILTITNRITAAGTGIGDVVYILYKLVYAGFSNGQILAE